MTPQEKKDRRQAKHDVQLQAKRYLNPRIGLYSTPMQIKAAVKKVAESVVSQVTRQNA